MTIQLPRLSDSSAALLRRAGDHPVLRSFPHGAVILFDHDLRYLAAGGLGLADVGLSRELLEGKTIAEVFPPEVVAVIEPLYRAALVGEESAIDVPYKGQIYLQRLGPLRDDGGTIVGGMGFTQDVTDARHAERDLLASQQHLVEEHRRLQQAQSIGRVGSWEWDLRTGVLSWSDAMLALYGLDPASFSGDYAAALAYIYPDDRDAVHAASQDCLRDGRPFASRYRVRRADDGSLRWFDARGEALYDGDDMVRLVGVVADVTEQVHAEQEALKAQAFYNAVLAASPDLTFVLDLPSRQVVYGSREAGTLGLTTDQLTALHGPERISLVHPDDRARLEATDAAAAGLEDGKVLSLRYRGRHTDGSWHWMNQRITPFRRDPDGAVTQVLCVVRDISDMVLAEERLSHAALHDSLTDLPNRALLIDRINTAMTRSARDGRPIAVLFCDLDGFKRINDTFGHATGDAVLVEIGRRLRGALREGDTVARVGGDEFVVLVEPWNRNGTEHLTSDLADPYQLAQQVAARIAKALVEPVVFNETEHVVTASIGITYATGDSSAGSGQLTAEQVVQDADTAMYRAKRSGKDRTEVFRPALRAELVERGRVERVLRRALLGKPTDPRLTAAYQPIVDDMGALRSFEALARLTDSDGTTIPPDVFIPIAEDTGQIRQLGQLMLNLACGQLAAWHSAHPALQGLTMSVNVSALQAQHGSLEHDIRRALATHDLQPADLILELTETALLQAAQSTMTTLHRLHADGVGIAIDDFGTGYASLRYLSTLPVSAVKVDRSFTAGLPHDPTSKAIVNAIANLAADLRLDCVVEGVETSDQRAALPPGVQIQGWLVGRPAAATDLTRFLP